MRLNLDPAQEGYSAKPGSEVIAVALAGGASRMRRDQLGASAIIGVNWYLSEIEYQYIQAFFRWATAHGSLPFTLDLILDGVLAEYTARFVPESLILSAVRGEVRVVEAQLEVSPLTPDDEFDEILVDLFAIYGDDLATILNLLAIFVNEDLPDALG